MSPGKRPGPGSWLPAVTLGVSGAAGLAHQLLWTRRLVDLLGASPETFARVVGVFFLGLAAGSALAARWGCRRDQAGRRVRTAELAVAVLALGPLGVVDAWEWLGLPPGGWLGWGRWWIPILTMAPPAMAMGLVFPAVLAAMGQAGRGEQGHPSAATLYAWNTVGGIAGVAVVVFLALPLWGLWGTGALACTGNLVVAWLARGLSTSRESHPEEADGVSGSNPAPAAEQNRAASAWVAAASGAGVVGMEVVVQHQFAQVAINSHLSSAWTLACVLAGLALGAWASRRVRSVRAALWASAWACALEPFAFHAIQPGLRALPYDLAPPSYYLRLSLLALATAVPLFLAAGLVFPRLLRTGAGGRRTAAALAWNGVGGWLGAEAMQAWCLPRWGLWSVMGVLGLGYAILGLVIRSGSRGRRGPWVAGIAVGVVAVFSVGVTRGFPQTGWVDGERVVEVRSGREGVVATVTGGEGDWRMLFNNTYTLGGSRAAMNQERQALLPLALHGNVRRVAVLGLATGSTAAGAALGPGVEAVDAFELSPLVAGMAGRHFGPWNRGVLADPRLRLHLEDARLGVLGIPGQADLVVGDLFLPWRTGEGRLYTREHFRGVRRALRPGGLYCQWLPLFQLTVDQYRTICRTFVREFPGAFLVRGDFYADLPIVGLCGFEDGRGLERVDWLAAGAVCEGLRAARAHVSDPLVRRVEGLAMCVLGPMPDPGLGPVNTLGNGWVEWDAGRNIVGLRAPWFIGVSWAETARASHRAGIGLMPEGLRAAHDAGQFFLTLEVAALSGSPVLANLEGQIPERLPEALRLDTGANWGAWPSRVKVPASARAGRD